MALRVYNTLTKKKEPFTTVVPGKVGMYVCGPTVYKPSHLGHMVGPVIFDTGTPQLLVTTTGMVPPRPWSHATLRIGAWTHDFLIGAPGSAGVPFSVRRSDVIRIVVGLSAMQQFDVYYDLERRRVGVVTR